MDWTKAPEHRATSRQAGTDCHHCGKQILAGEVIRQCPECNLLLHTHCFTDTEGGRAYATPGCSNCLARTYWR